MSVEQYQRTIETLDREIARLEKRNRMPRKRLRVFLSEKMTLPLLSIIN